VSEIPWLFWLRRLLRLQELGAEIPIGPTGGSLLTPKVLQHLPEREVSHWQSQATRTSVDALALGLIEC